MNMGGRDQSREKIKLKKFKKYELSPKLLPNNKNDDTMHDLHDAKMKV